MIICGENYFNYGNLFLNDPFGLNGLNGLYLRNLQNLPIIRNAD